MMGIKYSYHIIGSLRKWVKNGKKLLKLSPSESTESTEDAAAAATAAATAAPTACASLGRVLLILQRFPLLALGIAQERLRVAGRDRAVQKNVSHALLGSVQGVVDDGPSASDQLSLVLVVASPIARVLFRHLLPDVESEQVRVRRPKVPDIEAFGRGGGVFRLESGLEDGAEEAVVEVGEELRFQFFLVQRSQVDEHFHVHTSFPFVIVVSDSTSEARAHGPFESLRRRTDGALQAVAGHRLTASAV